MLKKVLIIFSVCYLLMLVNVYAQGEYDGYIIKYKDDFSQISLCSDEASDIRCIDSDNNLYKTDSEKVASELENKQYVEYVEPDYWVYLADYKVEDEYYNLYSYKNYNWPQKLMNCSTAWNAGLFGQDVRIGVIDSGVALDNSIPPENVGDYMLNVETGYDYIAQSTEMTDIMGHGTAITQIIASQNNKAYFIGIAPKSKIIPLKIYNSNTDIVRTTDISTIIKNAVDKYNCSIINMSFTTNKSATLESAIDYAASKGVILIAAVGNDGDTTNGSSIFYPAGYDNVIGVGAVTKDKIIADFSQHNSSVFCCAPGEQVYAYYLHEDEKTHIKNWGLCKIDGTSFAAPMVCGMAALLKGINPNLNNEMLKDIITNSSTDLGDVGWDEYYGNGLINIDAAVKYMLKDDQTFVSPIYNSYLDTNISVTNNTDTQKSYTSIWQSDSTTGLKQDTYLISPHSSVSIPYAFDGTYLKHILVNSLFQLKPLSKQITATRTNE